MEKLARSSKTDEDLFYYLARELRESPEDSKRILIGVVEALRKCLKEQSIINIRRLGVLHLKKKKPSKRRNFEGELKTQEKYFMIRFKPASSFREFINKSSQKELRQK